MLAPRSPNVLVQRWAAEQTVRCNRLSGDRVPLIAMAYRNNPSSKGMPCHYFVGFRIIFNWIMLS